jgi:hypothetical protein
MSEDQYVPQFCRFHWSWLWLICVATSGTAIPLLAVYLSWWIKTRKHRGIAFYFYLATTISLLALIPAEHFVPLETLETAFTTIVLIWWLTGFLLRKELREHFGQEFEISIWLTALFSVFYLNYCLWAISDAPVPERRI